MTIIKKVSADRRTRHFSTSTTWQLRALQIVLITDWVYFANWIIECSDDSIENELEWMSVMIDEKMTDANFSQDRCSWLTRCSRLFALTRSRVFIRVNENDLTYAENLMCSSVLRMQEEIRNWHKIREKLSERAIDRFFRKFVKSFTHQIFKLLIRFSSF